VYERITLRGTPSIPTWETLHTWLRERMQELVQWALEAEVTELLGRARYQRRGEVDAFLGYRNGYGKPRKLSTPEFPQAKPRACWALLRPRSGGR
jgi:transposase-like protein